MNLPNFSFDDIFSNPEKIPPYIKMDLIRPYINPVSSFCIINNTNYQTKYINHHKEVKAMLNQIGTDLVNFVEKSETEFDNISISPRNNFNVSSSSEISNMLIHNHALEQCFEEYRSKMCQIYVEIAEKQLEIHHQLTAFCDWLINNPHPVIINASRAFPDKSTVAFSQNSKEFSHYQAIKLAYIENSHMLSYIPPLFKNSNLNHEFLQNAIESAMSARKKDLNYFEPLQIEDTLFSFFECPDSPLTVNGLYPIHLQIEEESSNSEEEKLEAKTKAALSWISQASKLISAFDGKQNEEGRQETIGIFLTRFLFERTYPLLEITFNETPQKTHLLHMIKVIQNKTPADLELPAKYVPANLMHSKIGDLFSQSSITKAPVEWLKLAEYKICPLDAGYCISKAHESLTLMATFQAMQNGMNEGKEPSNDSKEFFSKVPGFDDIFGLWICLFCTAELFDARTLNTFIVNWSRLPGFSQRFVACCSYLEAAISQAEEEGQN